MSDEREFEELDINEEEVVYKTPNAGQKVSVFAQSTIGPSQHMEKLTIALDTPVSEIKYTLAQIFGLHGTEMFHLVAAGRTCDDDDIIGNYDIEEGDTLLIIPMSTAGCLCRSTEV